MLHKFYSTLVFLACFVFILHPVYASEAVTTQLEDTYRVSENDTVSVERKIHLTNTQPDRYVDRYILSFTNTQQNQNITVFEDGNEIPFTMNRDGTLLRMEIPIQKPAIGLDAKKILSIRYTLGEALGSFGTYRELFIAPSTLASQGSIDGYSIKLEVLDGSSVSIAKPRPKKINEGVYEWTKELLPEKGNILVGLGSIASYEVELHYELKNPHVYPVKYEIPFPPDGAFQKATIAQIEPSPENVVFDEDDNVMATYHVPSKSTTQVIYKGILTLYPEIRSDVLTYQRERYSPGKLNRYLSPEKYWTVPVPSSSFNGAKGIYDYVIDTLSYDDGRITKDLTRMGAAWALQNPEKAVCMEYTDLFIALSRLSGIPSREVVGYGVQRSGSLQPVSFFGDLLHAWPEYYDRAREIWHPIDPTWGDTAQLDYFSSFDMNHIALVYHGKETSYPLPPGVYKSDEARKDVYVKSTIQKQVDSGVLVVSSPETINLASGKPTDVTIQVRSGANTVKYAVPVIIKSLNGTVIAEKTISAIPPFGTMEVSIPVVMSNTLGFTQGTFTISVADEARSSTKYRVVSPWMKPLFDYWIFIAGFCIVVVIIVLIVVLHRRNHA